MKFIKIFGMLILGLLIMGVTQGLASIFEDLIPIWGIGVIVFAVVYIFLAYFVVKWIIVNVFKENLYVYRITKPHFNKLFLLCAILLPVLVYGVYILCVPGEFFTPNFTSQNEYLRNIFWVIFVNGFAAAIVEEMICRGLLMGYIQRKTNIFVAISITAIFFAVIHIFNGALSMWSLVMLLVSGILVGIMFGLATYIFNSIWASISIHLCWNVSQLIWITDHKIDDQPIQYVLTSNNMLITGGEFGFESSLISIIGYSVIILILIVIHKQKLKDLKVN
ncbi:CPBP family intramembrane metalloprotease [Staphylococcus gallinarum]|uniref:CPBP family intramembrane glutamic endopeptidase n=1 Tax=Staphylococcus gallinarum TaxID=1293 RepID=UPI000D1C48EC|nr:type II CAAX endopeptidase family protein [Staphylococcus gallinarum]MCD8826622.1 CPBP family intramembrane metalloprotease [Staphylococcus gallinarum]MEB6242819.1 CPBP family intramembrane metalloprotease [Staphylococcus gallinarum]MEB6295999.1 CPBP family intramembrane metalloprotease [Staphylococcus gallinarum]PTE75474.1 CPBP family intramembrane metalloprotease [Staphylococcus gallinarum]